MKRALTLILALSLCIAALARVAEPSGTYLFAVRDTCELYLDVYDPVKGSETAIDGIAKPTVLWVFGGGFTSGERDTKAYRRWFADLNDRGYKVVSIDYRLGLKGFKGAGVNTKFAKALYNSIQIAVEDLFSATAFIIENSETLGIDPANLVISGSSAGAITVLQAEWEICNSHDLAKVLPKDFNYAGVMAFSGAIFSNEGKIKYPNTPCPQLLLHGTADKIVVYERLKVLKHVFAGSSEIASSLSKNGLNHHIYRFEGNGHEIAMAMRHCLPEELRFLEENVMKHNTRKIDALVKDAGIKVPSWAKGDYKGLY